MECLTINPKALGDKLSADESVELIDVRTAVEFREAHAKGARNVPLDRLDPATLKQGRNGEAHKPLYVICRTGNRAKRAIEKLQTGGLSNVVNVDGGMVAWQESGLPVVRGKKAISLERQVRIAAGSLVLVGVLLGLFVHQGFLGLAGFVGTGLVFAGVTDTCGMGLLLARAPWNQVNNEDCEDEICNE